MKPLCIDLFCGLGGWTEGFLAEGWQVIGFDIEQHVYGDERYPAQLVLQDVRTIDGKQFKDADMIVASSPCQEFSYRAMPWKRAKALGPPLLGMELFAQAARIQAEAIAAAGGRFIPMIQENVRGAQKYVGKAPYHYGSYYLWGNIPALMPSPAKAQKRNPDGSNHGTGSWFAIADSKNRGASEGVKVSGLAHGRFPGGGLAQGHIDGVKNPGFRFDGSGKSFQTASVEGMKNTGGSWFNVGPRGEPAPANNPARTKATACPSCMAGPIAAGLAARGDLCPACAHDDGVKGFTPRGQPLGKNELGRKHGSKSKARKMASAKIAKIPFPLASHIARVYYPRHCAAGAA